VSGGIASSGDLAYIYGTTSKEGKDENYLRVWHTTRKGWKIILMTGPIPTSTTANQK
jgi:hypothetical protein